MRIDNRTKSLHYYNTYAVKDRIDISHLPETHIITPKLTLDDILPTNEEYSSLKTNFGILVSRMLCQNFKYFKTIFSDILTRHITHKYSKEMSTISEIVRFIIAL